MNRLILLVLAVFCAFAGTASADTSITAQGRTLVIFSEDTAVKNQMTIEERNANIVISDESDPFGMRSSPPCTPNRFNDQGNATQVSCPKGNYDSMQVSMGGSEDTIRITVNPPFLVSAAGELAADNITTGETEDIVTGEQGNDVLTANGGNDELAGGDGNDTLNAGPGNDKISGDGGNDTVDAGEGDDNVRTPDGNVDKIVCGGGNDTVIADTIDEVDATTCENVTRQFVAPPANQPDADDRKAPRCAAGGSTAQRIGGRRRTIYIAATSTEKGVIAGSGFVSVGGINVAIRVQSKKVNVAGGGIELRFKLSKGTLKRIARAHRRGRTPVARMRVVATDLAGNTSKPVGIAIRLRK